MLVNVLPVRIASRMAVTEAAAFVTIVSMVQFTNSISLRRHSLVKNGSPYSPDSIAALIASNSMQAASKS